MIASSPRKPPPPRSSAFRPARGAGCLAAALLLSTAVARAQALPAWNADARQAWWSANSAPAAWPRAADALQAQLEAAYAQGGPSCFSSPDFQGWMEHLEWIRLALDCPGDIAQPADAQAFVALGRDETVSHLLVRKLIPRDVKAAALQNLLRLAEANAADLHEYAALGVAYSIVFDEPFPADWPHAQVSQSALPVGDLDVVKRFQFYVQANRDRKIENDLTQLSFDQLKYLVDTKLSLSELAYAQQNRIPYDHFADAFFSIRYDDARVSGEQAFDWPGPSYTLAAIEKDGGICVDQAYYAATVGKGRGIPTIYFHGQGTGGGHAWFGYLTRSGKWELDCGRYASQNYPRGYALDPQTWRAVDDTTLANLAQGGTDPNYQPAENAIAWARLHAGTPVCQQALEQARTLMPDLAEAWQAEGDYLDSAHASLDDVKNFYNAWIAQFQSFIDMRVEGQKRLLAALKAAHDPDADSLQRDIILQNRSHDFDFGVQGTLGTIEDKFKAQDWDGAKIAFEAAVRDFKDQGGGTFFYNVIRPYMLICVEYGRMDQADDGFHFIDERMQIDPYSIVGGDYAHLKDELKILKDVLPAMQAWLGEMDDGNYAQAWNDGSDPFQKFVHADWWTATSTDRRKALGKLTDRQIASLPRFYDQLKTPDGKPLDGKFVYVRYRDTFEHQPEAEEDVVFMRQPDQSWRIFGYRFKTAPAPEK